MVQDGAAEPTAGHGDLLPVQKHPLQPQARHVPSRSHTARLYWSSGPTITAQRMKGHGHKEMMGDPADVLPQRLLLRQAAPAQAEVQAP
jgi:hypothetical protein